MAAPRQMTKETLNALKGWGTNLHAVDFEAKLDASVTDRVAPGTVVSINSSKKFILGVGASNAMPMFLFNGSDDPDVANEGGDAATEKGVWVAIAPTGVMMALVAVGAYELVSTNYKTSVAFVPNDPLTSPLIASSGKVPGRLELGAIGTDTIVGIVSRGIVDNGYGYDALAFWPVFLPVYP